MPEGARGKTTEGESRFILPRCINEPRALCLEHVLLTLEAQWRIVGRGYGIETLAMRRCERIRFLASRSDNSCLFFRSVRFCKLTHRYRREFRGLGGRETEVEQK